MDEIYQTKFLEIEPVHIYVPELTMAEMEMQFNMKVEKDDPFKIMEDETCNKTDNDLEFESYRYFGQSDSSANESIASDNGLTNPFEANEIDEILMNSDIRRKLIRGLYFSEEKIHQLHEISLQLSPELSRDDLSEQNSSDRNNETAALAHESISEERGVYSSRMMDDGCNSRQNCIKCGPESNSCFSPTSSECTPSSSLDIEWLETNFNSKRTLADRHASKYSSSDDQKDRTQDPADNESSSKKSSSRLSRMLRMKYGRGSFRGQNESYERGGRDEKRARNLKLPLSVHDIVNLPIDDFNAQIRLNRDLSNSQLSLIKNIRRRGKNKIAARNSRKRKIDKIAGLEREVKRIKDRKYGLIHEREFLTLEKRKMKIRYAQLYLHVASKLDEQTRQEFKLFQSSVLRQSVDGYFTQFDLAYDLETKKDKGRKPLTIYY